MGRAPTFFWAVGSPSRNARLHPLIGFCCEEPSRPSSKSRRRQDNGQVALAARRKGRSMKRLLYDGLLTFIFIVWTAATAQTAAANPSIVQISADPFTNPFAAHMTEVESDNNAFGQTMVGVFQVGRYQDSGAGSTDIGWSTSTDGGNTWSYGFLPGITSPDASLHTPYIRVTDPAVAFDAKHRVWLIVSLPKGTSHGQTTFLVPIISRSPDGLHWHYPVHIAPDSGDFMDKPWIACDNWTSSPHYGNCYVEYVDVNLGLLLLMSTSSDGGATWSKPRASSDNASGNGGQPIVQPNGTVLVPFLSYAMETISSTNGGMTWNPTVLIANVNEHSLAGGLRDAGPLPSAEVDGRGTAFVAWQDCSFRAGCSSNDIVYSTSSDGTHWSAVTRIPIDSRSSSIDHFLPGMGVDPTTFGANAHLGVTFYYLANANCSFTTCRIYVGFIASDDAGATWGSPVQLAGPMHVGWLPNSDLGHMIGDYAATSFVGGAARSTFPVAAKPLGGIFQQAIFTANGLSLEFGGLRRSAAGERPYPQVRPAKPRPIIVLH